MGDQNYQPGPTHEPNDLVDADGRLLPAFRYDYAGRCWWCGQPADSGEHKYKKTDLVHEFGAGPWREPNAIVQVISGRQRDLQSPGAASLKFPKVFCAGCNNARSQSFDEAYMRFANYVAQEEERILNATGFRWSHIFGREWKKGRNLVAAYWLKHIGCRFASGGVEVDPKISRFLDNPGQIRDVPLRLELQIQEDIVAMAQHLRQVHNEDFPSAWMGDLMCFYSRSRQRICQATCHWGLRWLRLTYQFDLEYSRVDLNFWADRVHLARISNLDPRAAIENCRECHPELISDP